MNSIEPKMSKEHNLEEITANLAVEEIKENNGDYIIIGTVKEEKALLFLKSNSLSNQEILSILKNHNQKTDVLKNDVFSTYNLKAEGIYFLRVIYPADAEKIKKYTQQGRIFIKESKDQYDLKLKNEKDNLKHKTNWLRNIIKEETEGTTKEKVFYSDEDIIIITNYKWDMKSTNNLYLLVLFKDENLYTVRELCDAEFLKRIQSVVFGVVKREFGLEDDQIYCFFHYPPTYYVLHLHVVNVNFYGNFSLLGKSILLDDIIANLEIDKYHYKNKTIRCFERK